MDVKNKMVHGIVYLKLVMQRSLSWLSLLNSGMILYLFLANMQAKGHFPGVHLKDIIFIIIIVNFLIMVILGIIDRKYFHEIENKLMWDVNSDVKNIRLMVKDIKEIKEVLSERNKV